MEEGISSYVALARITLKAREGSGAPQYWHFVYHISFKILYLLVAFLT